MTTPTLWRQLSDGRGPAECEWVVGQLAPRLSRDLTAEERSQHLNRRLALARLANLFAERAETKTLEDNTTRWRQHTQLIRGNPVRVYRGKDWTSVAGNADLS